MRDGDYHIVEEDEVYKLQQEVNNLREQGYAPQAQPFEFKGSICQVMTKVRPRGKLKGINNESRVEPLI